MYRENLTEKTFVFSFYLTDDYMTNRANRIHFRCIDHYSHIFDRIIVDIHTNNYKEKKDTILELEKYLLTILHSDNVTFKVRETNAFCEAETYYKEIVVNMKYKNGLYFFGHNKGITNYEIVGPEYEKSIDSWIIGMYYLGLNFPKEAEGKMIAQARYFYGGPKLKWLGEGYGDSDRFYYAGTFYWTNPTLIAHDTESDNFFLERGFAEQFPCFTSNQYRVDSHNNAYITMCKNIYIQADECIDFLLSNKDEKAEYEQLFNSIINDLGEDTTI